MSTRRDFLRAGAALAAPMGAAAAERPNIVRFYAGDLAGSEKGTLAEMRLAGLLAPLPHPCWEFKG